MWAGQIALDVGNQLVGVAFDKPEAGLALSSMLRPWIATGVDADQLPAVFTVRSPTQLAGRRRLGLVEHGCTVVARSRDLDRLLQSMRHITADMDPPVNAALTRLPLRVFASTEHAVLVAVEAPHLVGDRILQRQGVTEIDCWRASVDAQSRVRRGTEQWPLRGIVVDAVSGNQHLVIEELWLMAETGREPWSFVLNELNVDNRLLLVRRPDARNAIARLLTPD